MALRGIPSCSAVSGLWTIARPPSVLIALSPRVPSLPVPETMMQMARSCWYSARLRKKPSMGRGMLGRAAAAPRCRTPPLDRQQRVRRDDVDVLGLDQRPIVRLFDRHGGMPAQQLWQVAHMGGIEMRDHHKTEAALGRHGAEESLQCLEPPGRGTDRDYREVPWVTFPGLISIGTGVCRRARRRGASARLQVIGRRLLSVSFCHARIRIV
jgi:hypothetical protein